jgi:hypothetical protein
LRIGGGSGSGSARDGDSNGGRREGVGFPDGPRSGFLAVVGSR